VLIAAQLDKVKDLFGVGEFCLRHSPRDISAASSSIFVVEEPTSVG
jgi:hypothetical protein